MSIQANELRFGNWVFSERRNKKRVFKSNFFFHQILPKDIQKIIDKTLEVNPIPVDEKWLIKFGFNENWVGALIKTCIDREVNGYITQLELTGNNSNEWNADIVRINIDSALGYVFQVVTLPNLKYVHQLQNLYFALSGVELVELKDTD